MDQLTYLRELLQLSLTSVGLSASSTAVAALLGVPVALWLAFGESRGIETVRLIFNALMAVPTVVIGLLVFSLFSRSGPLGFAPILFTRGAIVLGQSLFLLPIVVSQSSAGFRRIDPRFTRTLRTLGIRRTRRYLMSAREGSDEIFHALLTAFGRGVGEVGIAMMLGGNIRWYTRTLTTAIVLETGRGEFRLALGMGGILILLSIAVYALAFRIAGAGRRRHDLRRP